MLIDKWLLTHYFRFFLHRWERQYKPLYVALLMCEENNFECVKCIGRYCKSNFGNWPWIQVQSVWTEMQIRAQRLELRPANLSIKDCYLQSETGNYWSEIFAIVLTIFFSGTHHYSSSHFRHKSIVLDEAYTDGVEISVKDFTDI